MNNKLRICFFSVGFAFNRLVRLRYYEKIFPKDVEMFLITTNKYMGTKEDKYTEQWNLERTKIISMKYNPLRLPFDIRKFCKKEKIDVVTNMGHPYGGIPLIIGSIFDKRRFILYFFGDTFETTKQDIFSKFGIKLFFRLFPYLIIARFADKIAFVGESSYKKAPLFFMMPKRKFYCLHAPVDVQLFHPADKKKARKELKINDKEKIIIYVGRVTKRKHGKLLSELIKTNPNIKFIIIGKWVEKEIPKIKAKNLITFDKIPNTELFKYYSAADLSFACHIQGYPMGIVAEESLACGIPVLHIKKLTAEESKAIIKIDEKNENKKINDFFSLSETEKKKLRIEARKYAEKYLSDEVWKDKYLDFYLN